MKERMRVLRLLCWKAVKVNLVPGSVLQAFAFVVVGIYFFWPEARGVYEYVAELKERYGYGYAAATTCVFGGLIPVSYLIAAGRVDVGKRMITVAFFIVFWTWRGVEVDFLYRVQALMFGESGDAVTVVKKVAFDQFVYTAFWSAPVTAVAYRWVDCGFRWQVFRKSIDRRLFTLEMPAMLVSMWMVWIPGTAFVYSMPGPLQLPLFTFVLCFFVLLVSVLGKKDEVAYKDALAPA